MGKSHTMKRTMKMRMKMKIILTKRKLRKTRPMEKRMKMRRYSMD